MPLLVRRQDVESRLRQERFGCVQLGALTVGLLCQGHELGIERPGFVLVTRQLSGPCGTVQSLKTVRLKAVRGFKGLQRQGWLVQLEE